MINLIEKYKNNDIWLELVKYDFSNENHKSFAPLFSFIKQELSSLTLSMGIDAFYSWKKAHRFFSFFHNFNNIVPRTSKQWLKTQNNQLWDIIVDDSINKLFRTLKKQLKNQQLHDFFKSIFGSYKKNSAQKDSIVEKLDSIQSLFEKNITQSKKTYFIAKNRKDILHKFSSQTLFKAHKLALKNNLNGYLFTLNYDNINKLLTFISDRDIRQDIYTKFTDAMFSCPFQIENQKLLNKGLILKKKLSVFYGHNNYSHLVTSQYMVTLNQTQKFINNSEIQLNNMLKPFHNDMTTMFHHDGFSGDIQPWDISYYQRILYKKNVIDTKFQDHFLYTISFPKILKYMEQLFNCSITYIKNINNNDVYEVKDNTNTNNTSYWVISPYSKRNEKSAFQLDIVDKAELGTQNIPWIQFIYLNIPKSGKMNFFQVKNIVHEIGHAFHSILSKSDSPKTTCGWDLIELPSQFLENLAYRYNFLSFISSSPYFSKKLFKQEMKNYRFTDLIYLNEKIIDFKTSFELNKNINPYSNKKVIMAFIKNRHSVGNYYNPFHESEHFMNNYESDYFSNYVYFFSETIAKKLNLTYQEKDFKHIFTQFSLDKKSFKTFIKPYMNIKNLDLVTMFNYDLFNQSI